MKIYDELLELSQKADKIIDSTNDLNLDIFKTFKEKASAIMSCETLEDLKNLSNSTEPVKNYKKFEIPLVETKVHLHSNKSSFESTSGISDQNKAENSSELKKENFSHNKKVSNFSSTNNDQEFSDMNDQRDSRGKFHSNFYGRNYETKYSNESNFQTFVKFDCIDSTSVKISSETSISNDTDGNCLNSNLVIQNINILEKVEEIEDCFISQKFVNVSTMIKTSCSKYSNGNYKDFKQNERNTHHNNSSERNNNNKKINIVSSVDKLITNIEETFDNSNIKSDVVLPNKTPISSSSGENLNNDSEFKTNSYNKMLQNIQSSEYNEEAQTNRLYLDCENEALMGIEPIVYNSEGLGVRKFFPKPISDLQNIDNLKNEFLKNLSLSPRIVVEKKANNSKTKSFFEKSDSVIPISVKNKTKLYHKQKKDFKKKQNLDKSIQEVSAIPILMENKEPEKLNPKKLKLCPRVKKRFKLSRFSLAAVNKGYNLRSLRNNPSSKTYPKCSRKSSKLECNKNLSLKEKIEEKKKIRELKTKLTRERRENIEKARTEKLRLSEERRIKRLENHNEILKRKMMEVKKKAKCRKLKKQLTTSSELSPDSNTELQSSQTGLNQTYLVENTNSISPIEPVENTQNRSSGEGLNLSLLYSSAYDKKLFMRQSVILTDIAKSWPPETIQNCLNVSPIKEVNTISDIVPNCCPSKKEVSVKAKKSYSNAPIKKQMRSTRKVSVLASGDSTDSVRKMLSTSINERKQEIHKKILKENDSQDRKLFLITNSVKGDEIKDSTISKLAPHQTTKEKGKISLDNGIQTLSKAKSSLLKQELVLKDITNSKSVIQLANKKEGKSMKFLNNKKRKAQNTLNNKKQGKKQLNINKVPENIKKLSPLSKKAQSSVVSSYEISDISDNSIDGQKPVERKSKQIPSWATTVHLKRALLKQHYKPQDTDAIFGNFRNQKTINVADIFEIDKPQYHNRTSSAKWSADESPV